MRLTALAGCRLTGHNLHSRSALIRTISRRQLTLNKQPPTTTVLHVSSHFLPSSIWNLFLRSHHIPSRIYIHACHSINLSLSLLVLGSAMTISSSSIHGY